MNLVRDLKIFHTLLSGKISLELLIFDILDRKEVGKCCLKIVKK